MVWNPYKKRRTEPDMRRELNNTLDGNFPEIAKAQKVLLRKMRRDANNNLVKCACIDPVTREPDKAYFCPLCYGEGNLWDEVYMDVYRREIEQSRTQAQGLESTPPGLHNIPIMVFYTRSSENITENDKVVELVLTEDGEIATPPKRRRIFRIVRPVDYRLEGGRLEYWKLSCSEEEVRFINGI